MKKFLSLIVAVAFVVLPVKKSYAVSGEIIFRDAMYGGVIGFLAGSAYYAIDQKSFGKKVGTGVLVGLILGTAFGIYEATGYLAENNNNNSMFAKLLRRLHLEFLNGDDRETYVMTGLSFVDQRF